MNKEIERVAALAGLVIFLIAGIVLLSIPVGQEENSLSSLPQLAFQVVAPESFLSWINSFGIPKWCAWLMVLIPAILVFMVDKKSTSKQNN